MILKWNKEELIDLLKSFYKRTYDFDVDISLFFKNNNLFASVKHEEENFLLDRSSMNEILIDEFKSQNMYVDNIMYDIQTNNDEPTFEGLTLSIGQILNLKRA